MARWPALLAEVRQYAGPAQILAGSGVDWAVLQLLQKGLSKHVHAGRSGSNALLWNDSNGPIWEDTAFDQVYRSFRDVTAMCLVLRHLGWPGSSIPPQLLPLFETPGGMWTPAAVAEVKARFGLSASA